ncbi:MAG: SDR family oxidoreductase [Phycisphaeraceae bacterium]|nr:SDR family oxidoreductase [Phycisphaeraceae bacterium]
MTDWTSLHGQAFSSRRVLITGGAGFIGSHLAEALMTLGADVVVLDDLSGGDIANLAFAGDSSRKFPGKLRFLEGSILDAGKLGDAVAGCDVVFHQGAIPSVPRSIEMPVAFHDVNTTGTLRVLEACRAANVRRIMFAASSSAYGDSPTLPKVETMPGLPKSPYAANKLAGEHYLRAYANCYDLDAVSLRYFNIFGPRQNANSVYSGVIAIFATRILNNQSVTVNGDGYSRDFTYVDNAVHANLLAARHPERLNGQVFNVACGIRVTILELAQQIAKALGRDVPITVGPDRAGDVKHSYADLTAIGAALGYKPLVTFEQGIQRTVQWYAQAHRG